MMSKRKKSLTFFAYSTIGGIIIATSGILARNALKIATGKLNFSKTQTTLFALFQTLCPGFTIILLVLNMNDETNSNPPDSSMPVEKQQCSIRQRRE